MKKKLLIVNKIQFGSRVRIFLQENSLEDMGKKGWILSKETETQLVFTKQSDKITEGVKLC